MKKFVCCLFAAALFACAAACAEYSPRKEDFDFGVTLSATEAECGEEIVYTVRAERVSGKKFTVRGSSTLYSVYFEPDTGEESYFTFNDDVVTHEFGEDYLLEESGTLSTDGLAAGEYVFAVWLRIGELVYGYEQAIRLT